MVTVQVRPRKGGHKTKVRWIADSGVRKTLISQEDWERIKKKNSAVKLRRNQIKFVPYGTKMSLPIMGKAKVVLKCAAGKEVKSTAVRESAWETRQRCSRHYQYSAGGRQARSRECGSYYTC